VVFEAMFICGGAFLVFTALILTLRIRRRIRARSAAPPPEPVFDMAEIRALLDAGKITQQEHDRLLALLFKQRSDAIPRGRRGFDVSPLKGPPEEAESAPEPGAPPE
jgi:hypothetical protein